MEDFRGHSWWNGIMYHRSTSLPSPHLFYALLCSAGSLSIFIQIVERLLIEKPINPIGFIVEYLSKKYPDETRAAQVGHCMSSASSNIKAISRWDPVANFTNKLWSSTIWGIELFLSQGVWKENASRYPCNSDLLKGARCYDKGKTEGSMIRARPRVLSFVWKTPPVVVAWTLAVVDKSLHPFLKRVSPLSVIGVVSRVGSEEQEEETDSEDDDYIDDMELLSTTEAKRGIRRESVSAEQVAPNAVRITSKVFHRTSTGLISCLVNIFNKSWSVCGSVFDISLDQVEPGRHRLITYPTLPSHPQNRMLYFLIQISGRLFSSSY